jgi:hypothetical protein
VGWGDSTIVIGEWSSVGLWRWTCKQYVRYSQGPCVNNWIDRYTCLNDLIAEYTYLNNTVYQVTYLNSSIITGTFIKIKRIDDVIDYVRYTQGACINNWIS